MLDYRQFVRFVANGLVATGVNFAVLTFVVEGLGLASKGVASVIGAVFGTAASFVGNRYFVFAGSSGQTGRQVLRFVIVYGLLALANGGLMALWSDVAGQNYRIGFIFITGAMLVGSYLGNRLLVFTK